MTRNLEAPQAGTEGTTGESRTRDSLVLALVGSGGDGVNLLGGLLLRMAAAQGIHGMMVQSYGPQIRGGESAVILRIGADEILYEGELADVLLCFRLQDLQRFHGSIRLDEESLVLLDEAESGAYPEWLEHGKARELRYPFAKLDEGGFEIAGTPKNMYGLALLCRLLGWSPDLARQALSDRFGRRPEILQRNLEAFEQALDSEQAKQLPRLPAIAGSGKKLLVETGNEAIARGSIAAGMRFFAGYPITPSSEVMETLIRELPAADGRLVQAEDEIAALGMVVGASFSGVPAMTATSGPGLSLMTEMMGLSSMAELPVVIVDCQRAGPATGMPSRTEQSDIFHAVYGGHGDFPRAVLGVFDVRHAFDVMYKAFQLSETYQLPVLVLSDAYIAQRRQTLDARLESPPPVARRVWKEGDGPARFEVSGRDVVSPFRVPGTPGGVYMAAGIEHTKEGAPTADTRIHHDMNAKRFLKVDAMTEATKDWYRTLGDPAAPKGIVAWGSQYGLLKEWIPQHPEYRAFFPEILVPFPLEAFEAWRQGLEWTGIVELSYQGQFRQYLASLTDVHTAHSIRRSGGVPLTGSELSRLIEEAGS